MSKIRGDDSLTFDDMDRIRHENDELRANLAAMDEERRRFETHAAGLERENAQLSEKLKLAEEAERCWRQNYNELAAQMEIVHLIFGGNCQRRDCCGCH